MHLWKLIALMESYSIFANGGPKVPSGFGFQFTTYSKTMIRRQPKKP